MDESGGLFGLVWVFGVGWEMETSWVCLQGSSFLLQTGLTEILATLDDFGFWLFEEDIVVVDEK